MNLEKLLEYIAIKRAFYKVAFGDARDNGNFDGANEWYIRYDTIDTIYQALINEDFAKVTYKNWVGKELTP